MCVHQRHLLKSTVTFYSFITPVPFDWSASGSLSVSPRIFRSSKHLEHDFHFIPHYSSKNVGECGPIQWVESIVILLTPNPSQTDVHVAQHSPDWNTIFRTVSHVDDGWESPTMEVSHLTVEEETGFTVFAAVNHHCCSP